MLFSTHVNEYTIAYEKGTFCVETGKLLAFSSAASGLVAFSTLDEFSEAVLPTFFLAVELANRNRESMSCTLYVHV